MNLLSLASKSRGAFSVPHELDFGRLESLWSELGSEANAHGSFIQSELERLRRLSAICDEIDLQTTIVEKELFIAEDWLAKLGSDDLSDIPLDIDPVEECMSRLNRSEEIIKDWNENLEIYSPFGDEFGNLLNPTDKFANLKVLRTIVLSFAKESEFLN